MRKTLFFIAALCLFGAGCGREAPNAPPSVPSSTPPGSSNTTTAHIPDVTILAENLDIPWDIAFLPGSQDILITERTGHLLRVKPDQTIEEIEGLPSVRSAGEGGLLGMVIHPRFAENAWIYLYATEGSLGRTTCRVIRYRLEGNTLVEEKTMIENIPGGIYHDGGRMAFGPDGLLYITTGDSTVSRLAQDTNSLAGKILRLNDDGSIPEDNPFQNAVWSYGHRNPQGLAWDAKGRLWETEHGRSGVSTGYDELNLIEKGKNYGWPTIQGDETREDMESPRLQSGPTTTWAPAGLVYRNNTLFFGGLKGERLYEVRMNDERLELIEHLANQYGRIRTTVFGPDGLLYLTTSNTDGRGEKRAGDDKLIRINPDILTQKTSPYPFAAFFPASLPVAHEA